MNLSKQQRSFVNSDEPYSAFIGGRQSGKSTAIMHRAAHIYSKHHGGQSVSIVTPTAAMKRELRKNFTNRWPKLASTDSITVFSATNPQSKGRKLIRGNKHILFDEFQHFGRGIRNAIFSMLGRFASVSIALTPTAGESQPSIPSKFTTVFAASISNPAVSPGMVKNINQMSGNMGRGLLEVTNFAGHKIIDINGQIKCVVCGESTTYDEENAFDRVASYGLFQGCDCE